MVYLQMMGLTEDSVKDLSKSLETKLEGKHYGRSGSFYLYHPYNMPNELFFGKGILVFMDKNQPGYYEVGIQ